MLACARLCILQHGAIVMSASTTMTIRISAEVKEKLGRLGAATRRSNSFLAGEAVTQYVEREWEIVKGILEAMADVRAGNTVSHEEAMAELDAIVEAARRRVA